MEKRTVILLPSARFRSGPDTGWRAVGFSTDRRGIRATEAQSTLNSDGRATNKPKIMNTRCVRTKSPLSGRILPGQAGPMNSKRLTRLSVFQGFVLFAVLLICLQLPTHESRAQTTDPNLLLGIRRTNQNVVLNWFGSNTVPYQLESSSSLTS